MVTILVAGCTTGSSSPPPSLDPDAPFSVYDVAARGYVDLEMLADAIAPADVTFFGEYHDDAIAHQLEHDLLRMLGDRRTDVVLGLEMFERDVQPVLERYLSGEIEEDEFLSQARPWGNYATDYRPLVELAVDRGWEVIATNLPQSLASAVARGGLAVLESLPPSERRYAATDNLCPTNEYWERFIEAMTENADSAGHMTISDDDPMFRSMFEAQCARDEAMAASLAEVWSGGTPIFHVNGAFHTDYRLGIVPRLLRRQGGLDIRVISTVQVDDPSQVDVDEYLDRADYLIFTREPT